MNYKSLVFVSFKFKEGKISFLLESDTVRRSMLFKQNLTHATTELILFAFGISSTVYIRLFVGFKLLGVMEIDSQVEVPLFLEEV